MDGARAPPFLRRRRAHPRPPPSPRAGIRLRRRRPSIAGFPSLLALLLFRSSSSDGHELCLDYTFPSDPSNANLNHCDAWKNERICADDDSSVGRTLDALKITSLEGLCRDSYVLPLLCSSIDGWSAHLYDGERGTARSVPFLCEDYARGLYGACRSTFMVGNPFLSAGGGVIKDGAFESNFPTESAFLSSFAAANGGYCFSGKPYVPEPSGNVESPASVCVERLSDLDLDRPWSDVNRNEVWINVEPVPGLPGLLALGSHGGYVAIYRANNFGAKPTRLGTLIDATEFVYQPNGKGNERGLLGIAFHKGFAINGRLFLSYTCGLSQRDRCGAPGDTAVEEFVVSNPTDPNNLVVDSSRPPKVVFKYPQDSSNHNGGAILFRPDDSDPHLYILLGDGGGSGDKKNRSQDVTSLLGKALRIDVDSPPPSPDMTYAIPPDNPFLNVPNVRDEIYALGLRNPWRGSFDTDNPSYFFVGDVGQGTMEEVDLLARGANYGWPTYEGTETFSDRPLAKEASVAVPPIAEYAHSSNKAGGKASVTGGYVVRTNVDRSLTGKYLFADLYDRMYVTAELPPVNSGIFTQPERVEPRCSRTSPYRCTSPDQNFIMTFGQDHMNNVYFVSGKGLHRIVPPCLCDEDVGNACAGVDMNVDQSSATYGKNQGNEREDNILRRKKKKERKRIRPPRRRKRRPRKPS